MIPRMKGKNRDKPHVICMMKGIYLRGGDLMELGEHLRALPDSRH